METILAKIVADKAHWLAERKQRQPLATFQQQIIPSQRHFYRALATEHTCFILECKKASPSKGLIRASFDPAAIASVYKHYASAISVLTDEKYFQGDFAFLRQVSQQVTQPVLCKDFIIDPYQILLARYYQADACLLMLSVLNDEQYRTLAQLAHSLNMGVLTEVSNQQELQRAITLQAKVVGINNRDLRDLSIDLRRTRQFAPHLPAGVTIISESGILQHRHVRELSPLVNGFLIGSALMAQDDLHSAVRRVILGDNKVCGLTRAEDAINTWQAGAVYGGLIFVAGSPRCINMQQACNIIPQAALHYVAVFRDNPLNEVAAIAADLPLYAVQLHGTEDPRYIGQLRQLLDPRIQIWRALSVSNHLPARDGHFIDRYLLDNAQGGSGQCFNWQLLQDQQLENVMLAGGINADNCQQAAQIGCVGLDINSGVEHAPGIKDATKLAAVFQALRIY